MMFKKKTGKFQVGDWMVFPNNNLITNNDSEVKLESRVMSVLVYLSQQAGNSVTIQDIQQAVWKQQVVSNSAVYRVIAELRKALETDSDKTYIKTISKKGYSVTQPVKNFDNKIKCFWALFAVLVSLFFIFWLYNFNFQPLNTELTNKEVSSEKGLRTQVRYRYQPATSLKGKEFHPALSPNGDLLAFVYHPEKTSSMQLYLQVLDVDKSSVNYSDSALKKIKQRSFPLFERSSKTRQNFHLPAWSNSGKQLAYALISRDECKILVADFNEKTLSLNNERQISLCSSIGLYSLQFLADDSSIAFTSMLSGKVNVHLVNIQSTESKIVLSPNSANNWNYRVIASPYNDELVILQFNDLRETNFYLYDVVSGDSRIFYRTTQIIRSITWGDSESSVVFSDTENILTKVDTNTGKTDLFLQSGMTIGGITNASQTNAFALEQFAQSSQSITVRELSSSEAISNFNVASSYQDTNPEFANRSSRLAFVSKRSGRNQLWVRDEKGLTSQLTSFKNDGWMGKLRWSNVDDSILFARTGNIYQYSFNKQKLITLVKANKNETLFSPTWSNDNRFIFYNLFTEDQLSLYQMDPEIGPESIRFVEKDIRNYQEGSNGKTAYFTHNSKQGLYKLDLKTLEQSLLLPELHPESWNSWYVTEKGIYYLDASSVPSVIRLFDFKTGQKHKVMQWNNRVNGAFSIDHQFQLIAHDHYQHADSDIIVYRQVK